MVRYRLVISVREVRGKCPLYRVGDEILIDGFFVDVDRSRDVCMHAFSAMSTLLSAFVHGSSAVDLGIGNEEDVGYLQCPDPGPPCTRGGTVLFEVRREVVEE